jgi:hypothetical protein
MELVVPFLSSTITTSFDLELATQVATRVNEAHGKLLQEHGDMEEDRNAEKSVKDRNEPARQIARRLKEEKHERKLKTSEAVKVEDSEMAEDDTDEMGDEIAASAVSVEDPRRTYEEAMQAWHSLEMPVLLSLEVLANLTSCSNPRKQNGEDDEMGWASDDEERMEMMAAQEHEDGTSGPTPAMLTPQDEKLFEKVASASLPEQVLSFLETCSSFVLGKREGGTEETGNQSEISSSMKEIQAKTAASLGNIISNMPPQYWRSSQEESLELWKRLLAIMKMQLQEAQNSNKTQSQDQDHINSLSGTILSLLRSRSHLIAQQIDEPDLELLLALVQNAGDKNMMECRQNAVMMLGLLCSKPHSDAVNTLVCRTLLSALQYSLNTPKNKSNDVATLLFVCQVIDVLMDMYSDDDAFKVVFLQQKVLEVLQINVPVFRKRIQTVSKHDIDEEDICYLRETALNASRFIKYKQGQQL